MRLVRLVLVGVVLVAAVCVVRGRKLLAHVVCLAAAKRCNCCLPANNQTARHLDKRSRRCVARQSGLV